MTAAAVPPAEHVDVLVVGAGPCGLTAAYAAAERGLAVELVESSPRVGGMAASFTVAGQRVDYGSHRLHPAMAPRVRSLLDELLGRDLQVRPRHGRLRVRDRWVSFPLRPADLLANLPPRFVAGSARDLLLKPLRRSASVSYADVVRTGLGATALADFHGPMAQKLWGLPPERLSAELAYKRISVRSPSKLAASILKRRSDRMFLYPRLGYGQIVDALACAATAHGAVVTTDTTVESIDPGADRSMVDLSTGRTVAAGRVLWTAPGHALRSRLGRSAGTGHESIPMRGLVLVYLVLDSDRYSEYDAHYVPHLDVAFSRLSEPRNYRSGPDPAGRTVLCAEIPADVGDNRWEASDDELAAMVSDGMACCDLPVVSPVAVEVRRLPSVYPVLTVEDAGARRRALRAGDIEGVTLLGRQGLVAADNLHHVIDMALSAVDCVGEDGSWDGAGWAAHRRRFDGFVVED